MESRKSRQQAGSQPKRRGNRRIWLWTSSIVLLVVAALVAYYLVSLNNALSGLQKDEEDSKFTQFENNGSLIQPPEWEGKERVNILFMGGDGREGKGNEPARSDSMMVLSIDPVTKQAHLFSLLRDTYVSIPGHGKGRANEAIIYGGYKLSMQMISELTGLDLQYYVYTEFEGFKSLVDAIGGITIDVEKDMNYVDNADGNRYDIHLKKGLQDLNGDQALQYVRFRHDATSDYTRTERQRKLLSAVAVKMQNLGNISQLSNIITKVSPYIETNITTGDMLKIASLGLGLHNAGTAQLPPSSLLVDERIRGQSVLSIRSESKLRDYVQQVLGEDTSLPEPVENSDGASSEGSGSTSSGAGSSDTKSSNKGSSGH